MIPSQKEKKTKKKLHKSIFNKLRQAGGKADGCTAEGGEGHRESIPTSFREEKRKGSMGARADAREGWRERIP